MRISYTSCLACLAAAVTFGLAVAPLALAQEGGGYGGGGGMGGGGMGGGGMGGGGGHHRGGQRGGGRQGPPGTGAPAGAPGGPAAPASISLQERLSGIVTIAGQKRMLAKTALSSDKPEISVVYAERGAQVSLDAMQLSSTGDLSHSDDGRSGGLGAALLAGSAATVDMTGGTISTSGKGANAAFVADPGSRLNLKSVSLSTRATEAYGIEITGGGTLTADAVHVTTDNDHAIALSSQGHDDRATLTGGSYVTHGPSSPAFSVAGSLAATGITATAEHADGIVSDRGDRITLTDSTISADGYGVSLFAGPNNGSEGMRPHGGDHGPPPGDAPAMPMMTSAGTPDGAMHAPRGIDFAMAGGRLSSRTAGFYVSNMRAHIALSQVDLKVESGVILRSAASAWGAMGKNGGDAMLDADRQTLTGDFVTDVVSSIRVSLRNGSRLTGKATPNTDVALDASSTWTLSDDSFVGKLEDAALSGDAVPNIMGQGHNLTYDARHNPVLAHKTYQLAGGGVLKPDF